MIKTTIMKLLLISIALFFSACVNTHGISTRYYSECKEYYDLQGFYHKDCDDDIITYEEAGNKVSNGVDAIKSIGEKKQNPNVW